MQASIKHFTVRGDINFEEKLFKFGVPLIPRFIELITEIPSECISKYVVNEASITLRCFRNDVCTLKLNFLLFDGTHYQMTVNSNPDELCCNRMVMHVTLEKIESSIPLLMCDFLSCQSFDKKKRIQPNTYSFPGFSYL